MRILGISAFYHDSAAALVRDGELIAAAQEERFTRKKHDARFPSHAIRYCLAEEGVRLGDVYSIGVLHHTPDPRAAFGHVAAMVRKGGQCAVYLYDAYGTWYRGSNLIRKVTTRLPHRVMVGLAWAAVPLHFLYKVPVLGGLGRRLVPISSHPDWRWRWLDTFDWSTPTYQWKLRYPEVLRWFRAEGFAEVEVFDEPIRLRGVKAG